MNEALAGVVAKLNGWAEALILMLPNLVAATVVVLIAWFLARGARGLVLRALSRATSQKLLIDLTATITQTVVFAVGVFIALGVLKLDKAVTSLLAGAGVVGLALAFAFQDIVSNFLSGILMAVRRPFYPGELIETNDVLAVVEELNLRSTVLRTPQGQMVTLPNTKVFQNAITNYTRLGKRRIDLDCGVSYSDDLEKAEEVALATVKALDCVDAEMPLDLYYKEFGDSSINFTIRLWVVFTKQSDYLAARSRAIKAIKIAFDKNNISIPFPIRTLEFSQPIEFASSRSGATQND